MVKHVQEFLVLLRLDLIHREMIHQFNGFRFVVIQDDLPVCLIRIHLIISLAVQVKYLLEHYLKKSYLQLMFNLAITAEHQTL